VAGVDTDTALARVRPPTTVRARLATLSADQRALLIYAVSRVVVLSTTACVAAATSADPASGPWPATGSGAGWLRGLARWDGAWYLRIAESGYETTGISLHGGARTLAFFPLYPLVVRFLSFLSGAPVAVSGVQLSLLLGALAAILLHRLVDRLAGPAAADRAALLFCFFPAAFVLSMTYAEAMFIAAACAVLLALLDRCWIVAGALTAVAGLARPTGLALVAACAATAAVALVRHRDARSLLAPLIGLVGPVAYWAFVWSVDGDPRGWLHVEERYWGDHATLGVGTVRHLVILLHSPGWSLEPGSLNLWMLALGLVVGLVGLVLLLRARLSVGVTVFGIGAFLFSLCSVNVGPRPRMLLAAFPLIVAIAIATRGRRFWWLLGVSAVAMVAMTVMSLTTLAAFP